MPRTAVFQTFSICYSLDLPCFLNFAWPESPLDATQLHLAVLLILSRMLYNPLTCRFRDYGTSLRRPDAWEGWAMLLPAPCLPEQLVCHCWPWAEKKVFPQFCFFLPSPAHLTPAERVSKITQRMCTHTHTGFLMRSKKLSPGWQFGRNILGKKPEARADAFQFFR